MNRIISLLSVVLIAFSTACDNPNDKASSDSKPAVQNARPASTSGLKIAYVHIDSLASKYEYFKELEEEILAERMQMENQFQSQVNSLEKDYMDAQREAASLSQEALAILQQKLGAREQQLMQQKQAMEGQLMESEQTKTNAYFERVKTFLNTYADENGYDMIYAHNDLDNILYINSAYDVTKDVVARLNSEYESANLEASK